MNELIPKADVLNQINGLIECLNSVEIKLAEETKLAVTTLYLEQEDEISTLTSTLDKIDEAIHATALSNRFVKINKGVTLRYGLSY